MNIEQRCKQSLPTEVANVNITKSIRLTKSGKSRRGKGGRGGTGEGWGTSTTQKRTLMQWSGRCLRKSGQAQRKKFIGLVCFCFLLCCDRLDAFVSSHFGHHGEIRRRGWPIRQCRHFHRRERLVPKCPNLVVH